ncbi:MAG: ATP-dependent DNA helicase RecG [Candidatus Omnitrophica bacterium]|nr:ATP-dependent DNA helicase RecG [Candidatus Omnitrophota bacterium]MBU0897412.1 ATP-dependent DNA helicase RecG [Candidatus Omnitrophota bacterium]MBU1134180.1 ATP-dependent DNA helicase RecG [Candidatus Omnitrophota bacterium]MBU1366393.1 ATP-dependent DNA helicase RecG [Candidatus Omnitrophota bacterium]MBU1811264.1 ATP-dependent DNA helicase RecG [Candidatus Omnitrophota bacterium]
MQEVPIRYLKGVGPRKEAVFNNLGIYTAGDLLYYFPFRYEDRRNFKKMSELKEGEACLIKGRVCARNLKKMPYFIPKVRVKSIFEAALSDETGLVNCVWFNQPFLNDLIKVGEELIVYGKPLYSNNKFKLVSPEYELVKDKEDDFLNLGRIIGVYHLSSFFTQKFMRKIMHLVLYNFKGRMPDPLPFYIRKEKNVPNIARGLEEIHFPGTFEEAECARERFIFQELFLSQILVYLRKAKHRSQKGPLFKIREEVLKKIRKKLPFELTLAQEEAFSQIRSSLEKPYPMHCLLQGDVGCGKTVVAIFAAGICVDCGSQAAFMVPTEVLAYQHKQTLERIFKEFKFKIEVLTSSLSKKKIEKIKVELKEGKINIIVGTHSLIQEKIEFKKLGLVVIDEQHRFGVAQRVLLPKKGVNPHCLVMSATPIPRSLALSLYGDLDLAVIKELPKGRISPQTIWVKEEKRKWVYDFLKTKLEEGRQIFVIYPVIEESVDEDLKSLEVMHKEICKQFSSFSVGMFHGKIKSQEKLKVIKEFREKKINILVSTTVVEVGINIENASVMVVENPERFGLAQLHQLRGRIQRSIYQPHFILISKSNLSQIALRRLGIISQETNGFKIAEEDLKLRGPGDFFGNLQHGLPKLKIANPLRDLEILNQARSFAYKVIKEDPYLEKPHHRCIKEHLDFWFQQNANQRESNANTHK